MVIPSSGDKEKSAPVEWLNALIRNVNGLGDRSAYGLAAAEGVIIVSLKEAPGLMKSGLQTRDVIVEAEGKK